jgi:hypothetical protein
MARSSSGPEVARPRATSGAARSGIALVLAGTAALASLAGAKRTPVTPKLPPGARPAAAWRALASLTGLDGAAPSVKGVVAMACITVLAAGFVVLAAEAWRGRVSVRSVVGLAVAMHVLAVVLPVLGSNDVFIYGLYGRIVGIHGVNPFTTVPAAFRSDPIYPFVDRQWAHTPPVYGPAFLWIAAAIARIASTPALIALAFKLVAAVASLATLALTVRLARRIAPERTAFAAALVGVNPAIVFVAVAGGHIDVVVGAAIAGSLLLVTGGDARAAGARRPLLATCVLAAAALVKFVAVLPLALLAVADVAARPAGSRLRRAGAHLGAAAAIALAGYLPFWQRHDPTFGLTYLFPFGSLMAPMLLVNNTLVGIVYRWFGTDASVAAAAGVRLAFTAAFATACIWIARSIARTRGGPRTERLLAGCGWALVLVTLSFQWLYPWYVPWFAPLAWAMPRRLRVVAVALSAGLPISTIVVSGDAAGTIAIGVGRLCYLIIAPVLLVTLVVLFRILARDQLTVDADRMRLVPRAIEG